LGFSSIGIFLRGYIPEVKFISIFPALGLPTPAKTFFMNGTFTLA